ncbi:MAG: phosphatidate cytidylyltransferase [Solirubrobacterales bacterium]|nr:phosphatidate cytidylyltransferase [Solirubrobacterales bacterium]
MPPARRRPSTASERRRTRAAQRNTRSDLLQRILVAVPAIAFAIFLVASGGIIFTVGLIALGLICLHELFHMFDRAHPARLAGFAGLIGLLLAAYYGEREQVLLAFVCTLPLVFLVTIVQPVGGGAAAISVTMLGLAWIGLGFAHAVLLRGLPHGDASVLVGTFLGDTGAYLGGRALGQTKLEPTISPNKTVEGLAIGILVAIASVWFAGLYQDWLSGTDALLLGLGVALAAPLGDLFESYLKRDAGTKDTGTLFGAHGGALDRLDAVLFTAVVGYYVWLALL